MHRRVLERHPDLASGLAAVTAILARPPVTSLFLTGGIALGSYTPGSSDVDFVAVLSEPFGAGLAEVSRAAWAALPSTSQTLLLRRDLGQEEPPAQQVWNPDHVTPYPFHAIEVILLRDYSVLLWGEDRRSELALYQVSEAIPGIIAPVSNKMLPGATETTDVTGVAFVLVRCLYSLRTGGLASKPDAAEWVADREGEQPALRRLAQALLLGGGTEETRCVFPEAATEFQSLVPAGRGTCATD